MICFVNTSLKGLFRHHHHLLEPPKGCEWNNMLASSAWAPQITRSQLTLRCNAHNQRMHVLFLPAPLRQQTQSAALVSSLSPSHLHFSNIKPTYTHCKQKWLTSGNCVLNSVLQGYHATPHAHIDEGIPMLKEYLIYTRQFSLPLMKT